MLPGLYPLYQRGHTEQIGLDEKLNQLDCLNVRSVVNLWSKRDPDLAIAFWENYHHIPIQDGMMVPSQSKFWITVIEMADLLRAGVGVLVQCHAGRNRSSLFSALVVRELMNFTGAEAVLWVQNKRPNALANPTFLVYLNGLEKPR